MKRPDSHKAGDLAENLVEQAFLRHNWIVNAQSSDYGYDFFVQYHEPDGGAISALLQVKALMSGIKRWRDNSFLYRLESRYAEFWVKTVEPVYLCIVDIPTGRIFAVSGLDVWAAVSKNMARQTSAIPIPERAELNSNRFVKILAEVRDWWVPIRFVMGRFFQPSTPGLTTYQVLVGSQGLTADQILTSDMFDLVSTRDAHTTELIYCYLEIFLSTSGSEAESERENIETELRTISKLDEHEIRRWVQEAIRKFKDELWTPHRLLELIKALDRLGRPRPTKDDEWLAWLAERTP